MAYIIYTSGDHAFQHGGYLYKLTSGIQWTPDHSYMSDKHQKQTSEKADQSTLAVVL